MGASTHAPAFQSSYSNSGYSYHSVPFDQIQGSPAGPGTALEDLRRPAKRIRHVDTIEETVPAKRIRYLDIEEDDVEVGTKNEEALSNGGHKPQMKRPLSLTPKPSHPSPHLEMSELAAVHPTPRLKKRHRPHIGKRHVLSLPFPQEMIESVIGNLDFLGLACMGKDERTKKEKKSDATGNKDVRRDIDISEANGFAGTGLSTLSSTLEMQTSPVGRI